jgi:hypothetical protein
MAGTIGSGNNHFIAYFIHPEKVAANNVAWTEQDKMFG